MRVLFSIPRFHPNYRGLVRGLQEAGHDVGILAQNIGPQSYLTADGPILDYPLSKFSAFFSKFKFRALRRTEALVPDYIRLKKTLTAFAPDVIICRNISITTMMISLLSHRLKYKVVLYDQAPLSGKSDLRLLHKVLSAVGLLPRHRFTPSFGPRPDAKKTEAFIPFGLDVDRDIPRHTQQVTKPVRIMSVAKLDQPRKNNLLLLKALTPHLQSGAARLSFYGLLKHQTGPAYTALTDHIAAHGIEEQVSFHPNVSYIDCRKAYADHDLFILASEKEPAGISIMEAMAAGLAVICSDDAGLAYCVEDGRNGFRFRANDLNDLRQKAARLIHEPAHLDQMGHASYDMMASGYTEAQFARRLEDTLKTWFNI